MGGFKRREFTEAEAAAVRLILTTGGSMLDAARAAGMSETTARRLAADLGLHVFSSIRRPTVDRMRDLSRQGWSSSRIARRLQLNVEAVEHHLREVSA